MPGLMNPLRSLFRIVLVALNGLDELPEARFEIPFILTGKLTMALNTPIMAPTDTQVVAQNKYFGAVSQTDLTRVSFVDGTSGYGFSGDTSICLSSRKR